MSRVHLPSTVNPSDGLSYLASIIFQNILLQTERPLSPRPSPFCSNYVLAHLGSRLGKVHDCSRSLTCASGNNTIKTAYKYSKRCLIQTPRGL